MYSCFSMLNSNDYNLNNQKKKKNKVNINV